MTTHHPLMNQPHTHVFGDWRDGPVYLETGEKERYGPGREQWVWRKYETPIEHHSEIRTCEICGKNELLEAEQ